MLFINNLVKLELITMLTFKQYIVEYLTDEQRAHLHQSAVDSLMGDLSLTKAAKARTDHFFGKDSDIKHEELKNFEQNKSEVHNQVEQHLGRQIPYKEYKSGMTSDNYGRQVKIGRLIKDKTLRDRYAADETRDGSRGEGYSVSIVRGIEVGGQSNDQPDELHPQGHSWKDISCKNITSGSAKHMLVDEIKNGTVVVRVHDSNGQEIHRSTLQPFIHSKDQPTNKSSRYMYAVNSSYGIKHPDFINHAHDVAERLSRGSRKPTARDAADEYVIHPHVYDDEYNGHYSTYNIHPHATSEQLLHAIKTRPAGELPPKVFEHRNVSDKHFVAALNRTDFNTAHHINFALAKSDKLTPDHINRAIDNKSDSFLVKTLRFSPDKINQQHVDRIADSIITHHEKGFKTKHPLSHVMRRMILSGKPKPSRFTELKQHVPDVDVNPFKNI